MTQNNVSQLSSASDLYFSLVRKWCIETLLNKKKRLIQMQKMKPLTDDELLQICINEANSFLSDVDILPRIVESFVFDSSIKYIKFGSNSHTTVDGKSSLNVLWKHEIRDVCFAVRENFHDKFQELSWNFNYNGHPKPPLYHFMSCALASIEECYEESSKPDDDFNYK